MNITARDIVSEAYHASDRTDIEYGVGPNIDHGGEYFSEPDVTLFVGDQAMVIAAQYDRENGEFVGFTWTIYAVADGGHLDEQLSTDGTDDPDEARAVVEAFAGV